jgi:gluconolactonase
MSSPTRMLLLVAALLAVSTESSSARPRVLCDPVSYPEGPWVDGDRFYFVAYGAHRVWVREHGRVRPLWHQEGSGPSGLITLESGELLVACYDANTLVRLDRSGRERETIRHDAKGIAFQGPNDFCRAPGGGIYFSTSGKFDHHAPVAGKVYLRTPSGEIRRVAAGIHYANGLAVVDGGRALLVNEHLARRILRFDIETDGSLGNRTVWRRLADIAPDPDSADPYIGPDGLKVDEQGNVYICQYGAGRVLITYPNGTLRGIVHVPYRFVTNIALSPSRLYVTAAEDTAAPPYRGAVFAWRR